MSGPVRSVSQAFAILRLLAGGGELTLSDICRANGLSPSSAHNLLRTLVGEGAIERTVDARRYQLAPAWQQSDVLTGARAAQIIARVQPLITRFARTHDTTCGLWQAIAGDRVTLIALGESEAATRIHMAIGQRQPMSGGSIGRALVALDGLDQAGLERRFARLRWGRPLAFAAWVEQVSRASRRGFGIDEGFAHPGVVSIGLPVPGASSPRLCLSASVFAGSRSETEIDALGQMVLALAKEVEAAVGRIA